MKTQSFGEELFNSISHGVGAALSVAGLVILIVYAAMDGTAIHVVSVSVYGTSLVLLYTASTLYHAFPWPNVKKLFHIFDHSAIYLLIAGTYTPFCLVTLGDTWGWTLFGIIWGLAVLGIIFKTMFTGRFRLISTLIYVGMGWLVIIAVDPLMAALSTNGLLWLLGGGLCYTLGVIFFVWDKLPYSHGVWHLFVLGGSVCHFFGIFFHVLP